VRGPLYTDQPGSPEPPYAAPNVSGAPDTGRPSTHEPSDADRPGVSGPPYTDQPGAHEPPWADRPGAAGAEGYTDQPGADHWPDAHALGPDAHALDPDAPAADQQTPGMPPPDNRITDPKGAIYQQPMYLSEVHQAPGDLTGRHARADTPLPMPGRRVPEYTSDGRRVPVGTAPVGPADQPVQHDRRLPVHVPRAESSSRRPFVLAAVLVAGVGVAAAVVAVTLPRGDADTPAPAASVPAAPPAASAPAASAPAGTGAGAGAPANVVLRDNRDSVTLTWTYPKGSEGPVLISGGRAGQDRRAFQQLPAGSADYVVYGLNEQLDYCFTVAVVHSTDDVATSAPICTAR
jgi:hypothetical protein